jgi:hypothetical protein
VSGIILEDVSITVFPKALSSELHLHGHYLSPRTWCYSGCLKDIPDPESRDTPSIKNSFYREKKKRRMVKDFTIKNHNSLSCCCYCHRHPPS